MKIHEVSRIGLGCWQLGGDCWGGMTDDLAREILTEAYESGVTFFDTADVYGAGESERRVGEFIKGLGQKPMVATKINRFGDPGWPKNFEHATMRQHIENSIRRLGGEALDLVQLHCPPTEVMVQGDVFESLRAFQADGLIKSWGVSIESIEEGLLCLSQPGLSSLQVIFNALRQKPAEVLLPRAKQMKVAIIVRLPYASGLLTGKFNKQTQFDPSDHRSFNRDGAGFHVGETFNGIPFETAVDFVDELKSTLPVGITIKDASMRWLLDHEAVTTIIPGASRAGQPSENMAALSMAPLDSSIHEDWKRYYVEKVAPHVRGAI